MLATVATAALLAIAAAMACASPAQAGYWMRAACVNPDNTPASNDGWSSFTTGTIGYGSNNDTACSPGHPMRALLSTAAPATVGTSENLQYGPPEGSSLAGGQIIVGLYADGIGYNASGTAIVYSPVYNYDSSNVVMQCAAGLAPCANGTHRFLGTTSLPVDRGGNLYITAGCGGNFGFVCNTGGSDGAWSRVELWSANLLLTTDSTPAGSSFTGSLLAPGAHGTADLAFTATDPSGPGVYRVVVAVDGKTQYDLTPNLNGGKCAPAGNPASAVLVFDWQQPCPRSQNVVVPIRTTLFPDGRHELTVKVMNAARNTSTVFQQAITTENRTTVSSLLPTIPAPAPAAPPPPSGDGAAAPLYAIGLDRGSRGFARGVRRGWTRSALSVAGTVSNAAGVAAPGVALTMLARNAGQASVRVVAQTTSDGAGHWKLRAPRGPSRVLTITYAAQPASAPPGGKVTIRETVMPTVTLQVRSPGGGRVRFSGRVRISPLGSPRPLVLIEVRNSTGWQSVGSPTRVSRSGRFGLRFLGDRGVIGWRYSFRAVVPGTPLFARAVSPIRRALIR